MIPRRNGLNEPARCDGADAGATWHVFLSGMSVISAGDLPPCFRDVPIPVPQVRWLGSFPGTIATDPSPHHQFIDNRRRAGRWSSGPSYPPDILVAQCTALSSVSLKRLSPEPCVVALGNGLSAPGL